MIDFWEILGRAVTDDVFRNALYDSFAAANPAPNPNKKNKYACKYADTDYATARALVVAKMGPVSLMALGEWFVLSMLHRNTRTTLNNIARIVQKNLNSYSSTNPVFYQTLGAGIVDAAFLDEFNLGNEATYGFRLSAPDRAALAQVMGESTGAFRAQSGTFHDSNWVSGCKDMVIQSVGHPYAHALEVKFP